MKKNLLFSLLFLALTMFISCGDDTKTSDNDADDNLTDDSLIDDVVNDEDIAVINHYAGSGSKGDLITFEINQTAGTYKTFNETTEVESSGSYEVLSEDLSGMYKITDGSDAFYAVELNDKIIAANFNTGNEDNTISFGVTSETVHTGNISSIAGSYVYIHISGQPVNGEEDIKEWGIYSVGTDQSVIIKAYATAPGSVTQMEAFAPEDFDTPLPLTAGDITGNWKKSESDELRMEITLNGAGEPLTGFVMTENDRSIMVIDMGTGNGFILGFKIEDTQIADIAGEYKFINVWNDNNGEGRSAGKVVIDPEGKSYFSHLALTGVISTGEFENIEKCPNIGNMYYGTTTETDGVNVVNEKIYFVVLGDVFMAFGFRTDNEKFSFASYAAGAKL